VSTAQKLSRPVAWNLDLSGAPASKVDGQCIAVGDNLPPQTLLGYATDYEIMHICQKQGFNFDREIASSTELVASPEAFKEFPIASVLTPEDLSQVSERALTCVDERFDGSHAKRDLIEKVTKALQAKGLSQTMIDDVLSVTDEMFTNAVFNAPFVDPVTQANPGVDRHATQVKFDAGKQARIFLAHDESRLLVGCEDPFGSLNLLRYLKKIKDTYERGPGATMNFGSGGAGLGSYIIFNAGSSLYFGVWPGCATMLCCVIPMGMSYRKRIQLPKHLHWIQR
jgi:hypothetical protein